MVFIFKTILKKFKLKPNWVCIGLPLCFICSITSYFRIFTEYKRIIIQHIWYIFILSSKINSNCWKIRNFENKFQHLKTLVVVYRIWDKLQLEIIFKLKMKNILLNLLAKYYQIKKTSRGLKFKSLSQQSFNTNPCSWETSD